MGSSVSQRIHVIHVIHEVDFINTQETGHAGWASAKPLSPPKVPAFSERLRIYLAAQIISQPMVQKGYFYPKCTQICPHLIEGITPAIFLPKKVNSEVENILLC